MFYFKAAASATIAVGTIMHAPPEGVLFCLPRHYADRLQFRRPCIGRPYTCRTLP